MTTKRNSAVWLALLLSCLVAIPPAAFADDTELFTTSANPNVLLMLDTTGSMASVAGGTSVGDLDGDGTSNTRMDILWKVVYTLLNADLSIPQGTGTWTCRTSSRIRTWNNPYSRIQVDGTNWSHFPASATVQIGSGGTSESVHYSSKSTSGGSYYLNFSPTVTFRNNYSTGTIVSITSGGFTYSAPYPTNHTEGMSTDFLNNLDTVDESILKARLGLMTFTTNSTASSILINTRNQVLSTAPNAPAFTPSYRDIWGSVKSYAYPGGGTPTARALSAAQGFFDTAYNSSQMCRQNYAVLITDGEDTMGGLDGATGNGGSPDYYSGSGTTGTFYPDGNPSSTNNRGQVKRNNAVIQEAYNLLNHTPSVNLFTVGVGVSDSVPHLNALREVLRRAAEQTNAQADVGASNPNTGVYYNIGVTGDNTSRAEGRAFFATDATELGNSLRDIFQRISAGTYSFTAPTVASVRMTDRNYLYKATFTPARPPATYWEGHLEAISINPDGSLTPPIWDADNVLKTTTPASRHVYTGYLDNTGWSRVDFNTTSITPSMLQVDNTAARDEVVNYVLGVGHDNNAKLGDIFHSKPVVVGPPSQFFFDEGYSTAVGGSQSFVEAKARRKRVIFVGTNDGMLHAFLSGTYHDNTPVGSYDTGTGEEIFGYIPSSLLDQLEDFVPGDQTSHKYYVDSSPRVADVWIPSSATDVTKDTSEWRTVLISGLRKGGNTLFALDVTDPGTGTEATNYANYPKVLWEYSDTSNVGQTWSEPFIGKVRMKETTGSVVKDRWVAIFGGGTSDDRAIGASLILMDIATGLPLKTFITGVDGVTMDNVIPAPPTAVLDPGGYIKFVYATDLDGSLFKFDLRAAGVRGNSFNEWHVKKIFQAAAGQPVYHRIEAGSIDETTRYLFFGTGDQDNPVSNTGTGKFYAVKDTDAYWPVSPLTESNLANLSLSITSTSGGTVGPTQYGWYVNFASVPSTSVDSYTHSGEKVLSDPVVFYNNVYFTTYTPNSVDPCGGGGIARVYGLQMLNAGSGLESLASLGESGSKVPYHVYSGSTPGSPGGIPSSPSLSIYPSGQSSIFIGFSTGAIQEVKIESPPQMKTIRSWKETF